jgi:hypothetical protein
MSLRNHSPQFSGRSLSSHRSRCHVPHGVGSTPTRLTLNKGTADHYPDSRRHAHAIGATTQIGQESEAATLTKRIEAKANGFIGESQFGFRRGCGTRDAIGVMRVPCERSLEHGNDTYICFVDFEKGI